MRSFWTACVLTFGLGMLAWFGIPALTPSGEPELVVLDVGQGSCALIRSGKSAVLVDAGPNVRGYDAGRKVVLPRLRSLGVERLDLILISHPDLDHSGGLAAIRERYPHARIAVPAGFRRDPNWVAQLEKAGVSPDSLLLIEGRMTAKLPGIRLKVWAPPWAVGEPDNDGSMFVQANLADSNDGRGSVMITGDASAPIEELAIPIRDWRSEVLVVGHHGSKSSTSLDWLREVQPREAVASVGRRNVYGHPHPSVVKRLQAAGIKLLRTDRDGELRFWVRDGHFVRVHETGSAPERR